MHGLFRWSGKWWPGIIPLVIFWAIAAWTSTEPLEADLAQRSTAALKDTILDKRRISVAGRDVSLAADAFSEDGRQSAVTSVEAVPGVRLVNDETRLVPEANPFVWSAERDVVRVTLGGSSPLPASKGKLMEAARAGLGGVEVVDRMNLSRGAPARFDNAALLLLDQVGKLKDGKITLSDTKVSLSGMARELGGREAIAAALKNLPEGFSVAANEVKAPPYIFQAYKAPVAVTLTLTGKADIVADSAGLLDRLIETALRCPTANIEIAGHTDTDGDEAANQALSEKRAQAVADYLVKAGLPADRFSAVGYGPTQPIAGNDTDQGKAQNRRIDFVVK